MTEKFLLIFPKYRSNLLLFSPGTEDCSRSGRRDSLSPDSAAEDSSRKGRRDSKGASSDKVDYLFLLEPAVIM